MQTPTFAEEAVLGALLVWNDSFHDAAQQLSQDHFTAAHRQQIWTTLRDRILSGDAADAVTVAEAIPEHAAYVIELASGAFTRATLPDYIALIRNNWRRREASQIAARLAAAARSGEDGVDEAIGDLLALNATVTEHEFTGRQAMMMAWAQAETAYNNGGLLPGVTTGLRELDDILGGWHKSDLTLIGARPAMGKTALMVNLAEAASGSGVPTGVISGEQPVEQIGIRRLSLAGNVGAAQVRAGRIEDEEWGRLGAGLPTRRDRPMWIYDRSALTLDELVAMARKWKHSHNIGILFIDYAQRITVPGADRITEVSVVARGLKNLARDLQIPVVSLAQVKAAVDTRNDKRPTAGDLANSDELTREADQILMLYRDDVYNQNSPDKGIAEILIEKNRHGPTGYKKFKFFEQTMHFADLTRNF